jgi:hypothetical protein
MGLAIFSQSCDCTLQFTEQGYYSEEGEEDEDEFVSFTKVPTSPRDVNRDAVIQFSTQRAKTGGMSGVSRCSLQERIKERHPSSGVKPKGEHRAHEKMVTDDTLEHIYHTIRVFNSMVRMRPTRNEALGCLEGVPCKPDTKISAVAYDENLPSQTLEGITPGRGKIVGTVPRKKLKRKLKGARKFNFDLKNRQSGLCAVSKLGGCKAISVPTVRESSARTPQQQIKTGFGHQHNALNAIEAQQLDTTWARARYE